MKYLALTTLAYVSMLFAPPAKALESVSNSFFEVTFQDSNSWDRTDAERERIGAITQETIDYWGGLLENYSSTFDQSKKITISLHFGKEYKYVAGADSEFCSVWGNNGSSYNTATSAMSKVLLDGKDDDPAETDIAITVNDNYGFYFGEGVGSSDRYDFHTVLLHELTHGMGFMSYKYQVNSSGSLQVYNYNNMPYDNLIDQALGGASLTLGADITLGEDGPAIYNPAKGDPGTSFSHLDEDSLMKPFIKSGDRYHELSQLEIDVFNSMGYKLASEQKFVPEPSTALLAMMLVPACLLRRRRALAK